MRNSSASGESPVRYRLRKSVKLKTRQDFDEIKENGRRYTSAFFTLLLRKDGESGEVRCGVICSRRFHKRAVIRNRARRLIWEAVRLLKPEILPCTILVIPRRGIFGASMMDVMSQMRGVLVKAGSLADFPRSN